jgi:hypothetical protein
MTKCFYTDTIHRTIIDRREAISTNRSPSKFPELHLLWADRLIAAILRYTYAANMAVVARVLELPRELRDNVYSHLWDVEEDHDPNRDLIYWWDSFEERWFDRTITIRNSPRLSMPALGLRPPHFVDKALVGASFAREVLERFKDTVGKDLRPVGKRNPVAECGLIDMDVEDFVKKDVFGVGITVEELARNMDLTINFQCDALTSIEVADCQDRCLENLGDNVTALISIPYTDRIITHKENSRQLQTRPKIITLTIRQESGFTDRDDIRSILKLVARAYNGLREKGLTVKVQYYSIEIGLKMLFEDDVWGWTDEDWTLNLEKKNTISGLSNEHAGVAHRFLEYVCEDIKGHLFQSHGARGLQLR